MTSTIILFYSLLAICITRSLSLKCHCKSSGTLASATLAEAFNTPGTFETLVGPGGGCSNKDECEISEGGNSRGYTPRCVKIEGYYNNPFSKINGTGTFYNCKQIKEKIANDCFDKDLKDSRMIHGKLTYCFCNRNKCNSGSVLKSTFFVFTFLILQINLWLRGILN